jgi:hypothetical protein
MWTQPLRVPRANEREMTMAIKIDAVKTVKVQAKTFCIHVKVRDEGCYSLLDQDGQEIHSVDSDYVPGFMPGEHYGDYLMLDIDLETGAITNWKTPSAIVIQEWINKDKT